MSYTFSYKRNFIWKKIKDVVAHKVFDKPLVDSEGKPYIVETIKFKDGTSKNIYITEYDYKQDKMAIFLKDGSILHIKEWSKCEMRLGNDYALFTKSEMEKSIGQPIHMEGVA